LTFRPTIPVLLIALFSAGRARSTLIERRPGGKRVEAWQRSLRAAPAIVPDSYRARLWHACRSLRKQQHESAVSQILVAGAYRIGARLRVCPAAAILLPRRR